LKFKGCKSQPFLLPLFKTHIMGYLELAEIYTKKNKALNNYIESTRDSGDGVSMEKFKTLCDEHEKALADIREFIIKNENN